MSARLFTRGAVVVIAVGLLAMPVMAQTAGAPAGGAQPAGAATMRAHPMVEKRISDLRSKLRITPEESGVFDNFAQVMRDNAAKMDGLAKERAQATATMTAVDQMKSYQTLAQAHAEDMQRLVPAFSQLYDALSPEQKKLADQSFREFGAPGRRRA